MDFLSETKDLFALLREDDCATGEYLTLRRDLTLSPL